MLKDCWGGATGLLGNTQRCRIRRCHTAKVASVTKYCLAVPAIIRLFGSEFLTEVFS